MPSVSETYALWATSLGIAVVVLVVVALLLTITLRTARQIDAGAKQIWVVGKQVANSTIQLTQLQQTNQVVADVVEAATGILHNAGRIAGHAQTCPGCPACVLSAAPPPSVQGVNIFGDREGRPNP